MLLKPIKKLMRQLLILTILFSNSLLFSQNYLHLAERAYLEGRFKDAMKYYESLFTNTDFTTNAKKPAETYLSYADACRLSMEFKKASENYNKAFNLDKSIDSRAVHHYDNAFCLRGIGQFKKAISEFEKFLDLDKPTQKFKDLYERADQLINSCRKAEDLIKKPISNFNVTQLDSNINTNLNDFAAHIVDNDLYFSTLKVKPKEQITENTIFSEKTPDDGTGRIFISTNMGIEEAIALPELNEGGKNVGNSALSPDGLRIYYTICEEHNYENSGCQIYMSTRESIGSSWGLGVLVPFNSKKFTNTHPNISFDSTLSKEVIYFVSNRTGGYGDMDIWCVTYDGNNNYGIPFNLGPSINTKGKEVTPYYHEKTQTLYFSSDWHAGLGGFDVFKSNNNFGKLKKPINVGIPLNTLASDLYFYIDPKNDSLGFVSSNRKTEYGLFGEKYSNNIYKLDLPEKIEPGEDTTFAARELARLEKEKEQALNDQQTADNPEDIVKVDNESKQDIANNEVTMEDLEKMLPLTLYFHDNSPDSTYIFPKTEKTYDDIYTKYRIMEDEYTLEYSSQFAKIEDMKLAQNRIKKFFRDNVESEFKQKNEFFEILQKLLEKGESFELYLRGYASPLASKDYNVLISQRRIDCFKNEIYNVGNGNLKKYLENGSLKIIELPYGESESPDGISDNPNDPKNSIYSPEAALQRKVQAEAIKRKSK